MTYLAYLPDEGGYQPSAKNNRLQTDIATDSMAKQGVNGLSYLCRKVKAMRTVNTYLAFALVILIASTSNAQIVDRTTDRATQKANNRVDERIDQGIDRSLDAIEGVFRKGKKKDKSASTQAPEQTSDNEMSSASPAESHAAFGMFGASSTELKSNYDFDHQVDMQIESFDKKGKSEGVQNMQMFFSDNETHVGVKAVMEGMNSVSIIDMAKFQMIMLMDMGGSKMAMAIDFDPSKFAEEVETNDDSTDMSFRKTGRTKVILGYSCDEYAMEDDTNILEFWVTREEQLDLFKAFGAMGASGKGAGGFSSVSEYPTGMTMEFTSTEKKNGEKAIMQVTKIQRNINYSISTAGYQIMNMPGGGK